jgi:hypothetical protein
MIAALQGVYGAGVGSVTPIPLPPAIALLGAGCLALGAVRLRLRASTI